MFKKVLLWSAVILTSLMIFNFSAAPGYKSKTLSHKVTEKVVDVPENVNETDMLKIGFTFKQLHAIVRKIGHILEFALLGAFTFMLSKSYNLSLKACIVISLSYCLLFAISDEIHQLFVDGRAGRVKDVIIDFLGSSLGVALTHLVKKRKNQINF